MRGPQGYQVHLRKIPEMRAKATGKPPRATGRRHVHFATPSPKGTACTFGRAEGRGETAEHHTQERG